MTARTLARKQITRPVTVLSPYSGRTLRVRGAREVGCHVVLVLDDGREVVVDGGMRIERRA